MRERATLNAFTLFVVLAAVAAPAESQVVRGIIVDANENAIVGAVATLLDSASRPVARVLTGASGEFRLAAPRDGMYRVRTLRIGFKPSETGILTLTSSKDVVQRIALDAIALALDTVHVENRSVCRRVDSDSASIVFGAWEQVRMALAAAQLTSAGRGVRATTIDYERSLDPAGGRVKAQRSTVTTQYVRQPWRSLGPDSLRRVGYVVDGPGNFTTYYAPGLDVLLSQEFVEDHCFRLARSADSLQLGVDFEPTPERRRVAEIRGTMWLDRASSELRRLVFHYANVAQENEDFAGGDMQFARLSNGGWIISRWDIRMPVLERSGGTRSFRGRQLPDAAPQVVEIQVSGGAVGTVIAGRDTVWSRPPMTLSGVVIDSASRRPLANARVTLAGARLDGVSDEKGRFTIGDVLPGSYDVEVRTPALDSIDAVYVSHVVVADSLTTLELRAPTASQIEARLCGKSGSRDRGIVTGRVTMDGGEALPPSTKVVVSWLSGGQPNARLERHTLEVPVTADGSFRLCGAPTRVAIDVSASATGADVVDAALIRIAPELRYVRAELTLVRVAPGSAVFTGTVMMDSTQQAVVAADVSLPELHRKTLTNETGAFRLSGISPGMHRVVVRRLGYGPLEANVSFASGERVEKRVYLSRMTTLDSVLVTASTLERSMQSFQEHRHLGLGRFLTRDDLAKAEGRSISATLYQLHGIRLARGRYNNIWAVAGRGPKTLDARALPGGDAADVNSGAVPDCYALVYVDKSRVYSGRIGESLFDLNRVRPDRLEGVEYYASGAETPPEYNDLGSQCGVLVLWTRRS